MSTYGTEEKGELRSNLTKLYQAGRQDFPDRADAVSAVATDVNFLIEDLNGRAAQLGDPAVTQDMLAVCARVADALIRTVKTLNACAEGLVYIADDFVARDEFAQQVFNSLGAELTTGAPAQAPVPQQIDGETLLHEGDGDDYVTSAPPVSPEADADTRNDEYDQAQDGIGFPEEDGS
ncbi:hypothetical protein [Nocardioides sp. 503]|uniref:hypothetical protein n=1 Tax=Nocardioides sp. 503 TaxID=2508326 RepID=UPI00106F9DCC|nr:hypothetical protein [Nocardioides sp. 503]